MSAAELAEDEDDELDELGGTRNGFVSTIGRLLKPETRWGATATSSGLLHASG